MNIFDGRAYKHRPCSVFTPKQVFGLRTAKSQPIWIKVCTHLLLYGIHLWADLDCDRRVGGSRPNQNDYVFCNTCNALLNPMTTDRRDFVGIPSKWRWGRMQLWKIPEFYSVGGASKNSIFRVFRVPFDYPAHPTGNSFNPNQWYRWKAETECAFCYSLECLWPGIWQI